MIKGSFLIKKQTGFLARFLFKFIGLNDYGFQLRHRYIEKAMRPRIHKNMNIINSGAGNSAFDEYMRQKYGINFFSADSDIGAQRRFAAVKNKINADVLNLPFKPEIFDGAVSSDTLAHVADAERYLKSINRVLKKGGVLFLHTPVYGEKYFFKSFKDYNRTRDDRVKSAFSENELEALLSSAGFKVIKKTPSFNFYIEGIVWELNEKFKNRFFFFSFGSVFAFNILFKFKQA